jgi:hypothetical protein
MEFLRNQPPEDETTVEVELPPDDLYDLDFWLGERNQPGLTRADAIRLLVRDALSLNREWERAKNSAGTAACGSRESSAIE